MHFNLQIIISKNLMYYHLSHQCLLLWRVSDKHNMDATSIGLMTQTNNCIKAPILHLFKKQLKATFIQWYSGQYFTSLHQYLYAKTRSGTNTEKLYNLKICTSSVICTHFWFWLKNRDTKYCYVNVFVNTQHVATDPYCYRF